MAELSQRDTEALLVEPNICQLATVHPDGRPHLAPIWMVPQRVVYQVTGHDVDTVMVDGKILMEGRKVKSVNEKKVLQDAQRAGERMVERSGVAPFMGMPDRFWGNSRY